MLGLDKSGLASHGSTILEPCKVSSLKRNMAFLSDTWKCLLVTAHLCLESGKAEANILILKCIFISNDINKTFSGIPFNPYIERINSFSKNLEKII